MGPARAASPSPAPSAALLTHSHTTPLLARPSATLRRVPTAQDRAPLLVLQLLARAFHSGAGVTREIYLFVCEHLAALARDNALVAAPPLDVTEPAVAHHLLVVNFWTEMQVREGMDGVC